MATAQITINGQVGSREDLVLGVAAIFANQDDTGVTEWAWTLLSRPEGSAAALSSGSDPTTQLTPDVAGSYLVELQVNQGEAVNAEYGAVRTPRLGLRIPAPGETTEGAATGWAYAMERILRVRLDRVGAAGAMEVCVNGEAAPLPLGAVVRVNGLATLPGTGVLVPLVELATAGTVGVHERVGVVFGRVDLSTGEPASGERCLVQFCGFAPLVLSGGVPVAGDPLYLGVVPGQLEVAGARDVAVSTGSGTAFVLGGGGGGAAPAASAVHTPALGVFGPFAALPVPYDIDAGWFAFAACELTDFVLLKSEAGVAGTTTVVIAVNGAPAQTLNIAAADLVQRTTPVASIAVAENDRVTATVTAVETGAPVDLVVLFRAVETLGVPVIPYKTLTRTIHPYNFFTYPTGSQMLYSGDGKARAPVGGGPKSFYYELTLPPNVLLDTIRVLACPTNPDTIVLRMNKTIAIDYNVPANPVHDVPHSESSVGGGWQTISLDCGAQAISANRAYIIEVATNAVAGESYIGPIQVEYRQNQAPA